MKKRKHKGISHCYLTPERGLEPASFHCLAQSDEILEFNGLINCWFVTFSGEHFTYIIEGNKFNNI